MGKNVMDKYKDKLDSIHEYIMKYNKALRIYRLSNESLTDAIGFFMMSCTSNLGTDLYEYNDKLSWLKIKGISNKYRDIIISEIII